MKQGTIVTIENCPPLHGEVLKDRPAVVLFDNGDEGGFLVACSSMPRDPAAYIQLPDRTTQPQCRTGLSRPTWAIHEWVLFASSERMKAMAKQGQSRYVGGPLFNKIRALAIDFLDAALPL